MSPKNSFTNFVKTFPIILNFELHSLLQLYLLKLMFDHHHLKVTTILVFSSTEIGFTSEPISAAVRYGPMYGSAPVNRDLMFSVLAVSLIQFYFFLTQFTCF